MNKFCINYKCYILSDRSDVSGQIDINKANSVIFDTIGTS